MKKLWILMTVFILLSGVTLSVQAAETAETTSSPTTTATAESTSNPPADHGELTLLGGTAFNSQGNVRLSKHFDGIEIYKDNALKLGLLYRASDSFSVNAGVRYDFEDKASIPFGRVDAIIPFGDNLKIAVFGDQNYEGDQWTRYEAAVRIEVYNNLFIYSGVRGEFGYGVPTYSYNLNNEPYLFLRGDFNWKAGKFEFGLQPYLYICGEGIWFHNYTIKYHASNNVALVVNMNTLFDQSPKLLAGIQWKF